MNVSVALADTETVLSLSGRFDAHEVEAYRAAADPVVDVDSASIVVDLEAVNFIDSSALAELVRSMKHVRERGGELVLRNPSDPVQIILELTGLDLAFTIT
ncbi:anti-sigma B factor antagonist [Ilumatobacter fluminis]|uniref:Anti-sigma factor antagonist n=1 Tax=Ilumatobacter fluminis TaxID=467091 RepID=A0A4R7I360_9ACTN|nr:STAS domain-containing protein [Ilumatobacter fluminis]TDT18062.1 anti-sigma B factor antagonist [Ilumatobacter fluminis]